MDLIVFLLSFAIILIACEFFTNGVEWTGRRFNLSEGAVGSVLAAVGTALPETLVPLIAILMIGGDAGHEIGVGAILGAPFMLATLALFICGLSVLIFAKRRNTRTLHINGKLIRRDLKFFLLAYALAAVAAFTPPEFGIFKTILGFTLIPLYIVYTIYTLKTGEAATGGDDMKALYLDSVIKRCIPGKADKDCPAPREPSTALIIVQVLAALGAIILGANLFVNQINAIAMFIGINPLILSLVISPIATELPEKFNSMLWIRERKDTYAIGNITGAMVFQSCIPVTIGIFLTSWHLNIANPVELLEAMTIGIALLSGIILYIESSHKELKMSGLMIGGLLYVLFFVAVLLSI
ncbi:sodium/calcium exchanger protein [Methanocella paludicola SANAE]|uniref:Sodium/calcium exchanger protein n=1 Tax=Methanocella paludicola (strain DSM 17711 / JCM 13418 / NBRC 101707 / SANAE) TaxID=304371 RepID=D1YV69_METPS|nr:sodium:calcium antiporter [Methanocella paludicola]BAI60341.1 sodium/calcium exchanger protein [Methanocella paludicola SANAE]